jgi:DNA-directed RNA polymerase subunit E"
MVEQACRNCHFLTTANICPNCKKTELSREWAGELIVFNPEKSEMAKKIGIKKPGRYALRVR